MILLRELEKSKWSTFVKNHPKGNIFQTPELQKVYYETTNYKPLFLAVVDLNTGEVLGTLLAVIQREHEGFLGIFSSRSIIISGPLVKDDNCEVLEFILKEYTKITKGIAIYSQFRNYWCQDSVKESYFKNGFDFVEHYNILVDISIEVDLLYKNLHKSRKEGIRKAMRNNLVFEVHNNEDIIPVFYDLLRITYKNAKLPFPRIDFFYNLSKYIPADNIKYFTLRKDDDVVICLIALIFKKKISAFYIGTKRDLEVFRMRPVDLFYWEVMKWAKDNGCDTFDWMGAGSPNEGLGLRKFKLEFGGTLKEYGRYETIHKPLLMKTSSLGLKIWQKLK